MTETVAERQPPHGFETRQRRQQKHAPRGSTILQRLMFHSAPSPCGCRLWTARRNAGGYGTLNVAGKSKRAHRMAWEQAHGPIPAGLDALHRCDTPACIEVAHLFLGTDADNMADRDSKGRHRPLPGEENGNAKLKNADVLEIRKGSGPLRLAAEKYDVHLSLIWLIRKGKAWKHL